MSITNLTGTTWIIKEQFDALYDSDIFGINFVTNSQNYGGFYPSVTDPDLDMCTMYYMASPSSSSRDWITVADGEAGSIVWENEAYRTITITGGTDATNATLITWLKQNVIISVDVASLANYASISAGQHTISAVATSSEYRNSLPTDLITFNKLSTVTNESVNEDTYTFNSVADADNYDIYVDDGAGHVYLLGTLSPFDYDVEDNTVTIDDAVYTTDNGVVTIE